MKYSIIGGCPFSSYTGTTTYTSLRVIGIAQTKEEVTKIIDTHYCECGGLVAVIDLETGELAEGVPFGKE